MQAPQRSSGQAPKEPGVYIWRNNRGRPIYIGKAINLRSRLSHYKKPADARIAAMVREAKGVTWQITPTDIEALILESQLIKKYHPKYNVVMRDDKQYFFVGFTHDNFPRIFLTHQPSTTVSGKRETSFIGPFTEGVPLKTTLRLLRNLFPYCTCKQKHQVKCLNAHIGKCLGFCCLKPESFQLPVGSSQKNWKLYMKNIRAIKDILTGKRNTVIRRLEKEMKILGATGKLEEAFTLQKKIERVKRVFENARISARLQTLTQTHKNSPHRVEGYDVANISGVHAVGAMVVFTDGTPDKSQYRLFTIKTSGGDTDMLREMLRRRLKHPEWPLPDLIVIDGGKAQLNVAKQCMPNVRSIAVTKDAHHRPRRNPNLSPALDDLVIHVDTEAHRFAISHYRKRHRKALK